jgi:hypothetical protein
MKIGYHLLPVALEGLSYITHLINIDTIQDLILILKSFLFQDESSSSSSSATAFGSSSIMNPHTPYEVKLLSLHCILKTLSFNSGKDILQVDDEPYLLLFKQMLREFPSVASSLVADEEDEQETGNKPDSSNNKKQNKRKNALHLSLNYYWKIIFENVDILFVQKSHDSIYYQNYLISIVRLLLSNISSQVKQHNNKKDNKNGSSAQLEVVLLTFIHNLLLKYPRIKQNLIDLNVYHKLEKEQHQQQKENSRNYMVEENEEEDEGDEGDEEGEEQAEETANQKKKRKKKNNKKSKTTDTPQLFIEDDKVEDLAMKGLQDYNFIANHKHRKSSLSFHSEKLDDSVENTANLLLSLSSHSDKRYSSIISKILSKDFLPLPFQWKDLYEETRKAEEEAPSKRSSSNNNGGGGNKQKSGGRKMNQGKPLKKTGKPSFNPKQKGGAMKNKSNNNGGMKNGSKKRPRENDSSTEKKEDYRKKKRRT